jgi:hypothetical protein
MAAKYSYTASRSQSSQALSQRFCSRFSKVQTDSSYVAL